MSQSEPNRIASRESWKTLTLPSKRENLCFNDSYSEPEFNLMKHGVIPAEMEDKWFIFYEEPWLYFHRSWTGAAIYGVRFELSNETAKAVESWVNREPSQYQETRTDYDKAVVKFLIEAFLLGRQASFPVPPDVPSDLPTGAYQHHVVGRAFPEASFSETAATRTSWLWRLCNFFLRRGR